MTLTYIAPWLTMSSLVLAEYLFKINGHTPTAWEQKGVAVAGYTVATLCESDALFS